jgi:4-carboxymuconolactone decarboxylase
MREESRRDLEPRILHLIRISLCAAAGRLEELEGALRGSLSAGVSLTEIREAILETYLFAGYPKAINALGTLREVTGGGGAEADLRAEGSDDDAESPATLEQRGLRLMDLVYGKSLAALLSNMRALDPDLARWIVREGYGKVLARPGLDMKTRELCVISILKITDALPQLDAHVKGAMNAGAEQEEIDLALALAEKMRLSLRE